MQPRSQGSLQNPGKEVACNASSSEGLPKQYIHVTMHDAVNKISSCIKLVGGEFIS